MYRLVNVVELVLSIFMDAALPRSKSNFNRTVGHETRLPLFSCICIFLLDQRGMNTRVLLGSVHVLHKMDVFNLLCPRSSNHVVSLGHAQVCCSVFSNGQ